MQKEFKYLILLYSSGIVFSAPKLFRKSETNSSSVNGSPESVSHYHKSEVFMSTTEFIKKAGFPAETHKVTTEDGYILQVHRIPNDGHATSATTSTRVPVLVMNNPFAFDSSSWVLNMRNQSLAFVLADAGFDVWLGNHRGNNYAKKHVKLRSSQRDFWRFSYNEMGLYDLPATVDYVREKTGFNKIFCISHASGDIAALMMYSAKPEYNDRVEAHVFLSPYWRLNTFTKPHMFERIFATLGMPLNNLEIAYTNGEMFPTKAYAYCNSWLWGEIFPSLMYDYFFPLMNGGHRVTDVNTTRTAVYLAHFFSDMAFAVRRHLMQIYIKGHVTWYDWGTEGNKQKYNKTSAPDLKLDNVRIPLFLVVTPEDRFISKHHAENLAKDYRKAKTFMVQPPDWTHLHYVIATNAKSVAFDPIINYFQEFRNDTQNITVN